jgi:hypothetical protein
MRRGCAKTSLLAGTATFYITGGAYGRGQANQRLLVVSSIGAAHGPRHAFPAIPNRCGSRSLWPEASRP